MPFVRVELVVFALAEGELRVLLAKRTGEPHAGKWALPGGVLRIDLDADLPAAAQRIAQERIGTALPAAQVLTAVGSSGRDPRSPWALSVVFRSTVLAAELQASPGKRTSELKWEPAQKAAGDRKLAFDHAELISQALAELQAEVQDLHFPTGLLAEPFTLGDLQAAGEAVLGKPLDKSSFRRRLDAAGVVEAVPGEIRTGPFRPAQMYRLLFKP